MIRVERVRSLRQVDPDVWDALVAPDRIICTHAYLRAIEASSLNDCSYHYFLFYEDQRLVGHACLYTMSFDLDLFNQGPSRALIAGVRRFFPRFLHLRLLECGTPAALGNTISVAPGVDLELVLGPLVREAEALAREEGVGLIVVRDFSPDETKEFDLFLEHGFRRLQNLPNMSMDMPWPSFGDYLGALRKRYRQNARAYLGAAAEGGVRTEVRSEFGDLAEEMYRLYWNVYERAWEYRRERLTPAYFRNLDGELGQRSEAVLLWRGEELVAFYVAAIDEKTYRPYYLGLSYPLNRPLRLLFNLQLMCVRRAIELGKKHLELGITNYAPKASLGAELAPLFVYMKHRNPLAHKVVTALFSRFTPPPTVPGRHVFRRGA